MLIEVDGAKELRKLLGPDPAEGFAVGDSVTTTKHEGRHRYKIHGRIVAKHKKFALVDFGCYRECFSYSELEKGRRAG